MPTWLKTTAYSGRRDEPLPDIPHECHPRCLEHAAREHEVMKRITYAGESVLTTDDVATVLIELTAALAKRGLAEAVRIPIFDQRTSSISTAELVAGLGNDVLAVPEVFDGEQPDFTAEAEELRQRVEAVSTRGRNTMGAQTVATPMEDDYDYDLGIDDIERPAS